MTYFILNLTSKIFHLYLYIRIQIYIGLIKTSFRFFFLSTDGSCAFCKFLEAFEIVIATPLVAGSLCYIVKNKSTEFLEFSKFYSKLNIEDYTVHL